MATSDDSPASKAAGTSSEPGHHSRPAHEPTVGELLENYRAQRAEAQTRADAAQAESDRHQRVADTAIAEVQDLHEKEVILLKKIPDQPASGSVHAVPASHGHAATKPTSGKTNLGDKAGTWLQTRWPKLFPPDNHPSS